MRKTIEQIGRLALLCLFFMQMQAVYCSAIFWNIFPNTEHWSKIVDSMPSRNLEPRRYVQVYTTPLRELLGAESNFALNPIFIKGAILSLGSFCVQAMDLPLQNVHLRKRDQIYIETLVLSRLNHIWEHNPISATEIMRVFRADHANAALSQLVLDNIAVSTSTDIWRQRQNFVKSHLEAWMERHRSIPYNQWRGLLPRTFPMYMIQEHFVKGLTAYQQAGNLTERTKILKDLQSLPEDHSKLYIDLMQSILWFFVAISVVAIDWMSYGSPFIRKDGYIPTRQ